MDVPIDEAKAQLHQEGYYVAYVPASGEEAVRLVLDVGRSLGKLFVPQGCDPNAPIIRTAPTYAQQAAPFDRPEPIGWHGDFATYEDRPELSLVYITRPDPRGGEFGAWRLASVARVVGALRATDEGQKVLEFLSRERLPFSYADGENPHWFTVLEPTSNGRIGLRFYLPSIRRGCLAEYGEVPLHIAAALTALELVADEVSEVVPTHQGSLLITSNWFALHDRTQQTISHAHQDREALLCFVTHLHRDTRS